MPPKVEILKFADKSGAYKRQPSKFRNFISNSADAQFKPETNRYHLYVSLACPWAHRALIARQLKGLTPIISVSIVHWHMDSNGWRFISSDEESQKTSPGDTQFGTTEPLYGFQRLSQLYYKADPNYEGRFTVPVLWDKKLATIVNNESSDILRIFNTEFNLILSSEHASLDLYPPEIRPEIDDINQWVYDNINNGVYKTGFATKQQVYDEEVQNLFLYLDKVEQVLQQNHTGPNQYEFLLGNTLTEADIRLYTTIIRFDVVYHQHFKCNIKMIRHDYPHLHRWVRLLYWKIPGFSDTTDFLHIKNHYTKSHSEINPHAITPLGPLPNVLPL